VRGPLRDRAELTPSTPGGRARGGRSLRATLAAALALSSAAGNAAPADPLAVCDERFARAPDDYDSSFCYYLAARDHGIGREAARRLEDLAARAPRNFWPVLVRGHLDLQARPEEAERFYVEAARGFSETRHAPGEIAARYNLRALYQRKGRIEEAGNEAARAVAAAEASGEPALLAQALTLEALHLVENSLDLGRAYRSLRRAEAAAFPSGAYRQRREILLGLGNVCHGMGRFEEALGHYRRLAVLTREEGDALNEATALYNVANTRLRQLEELPEEGGKDEVREAAEGALRAARASGNRDMEAMAHRTLGELLEGAGDRGRAAAREHLDRCLEVARALGQPRETSHCLWALGIHLAEDEPARAAALVDESLRVALAAGDVTGAAFAWRQRLRMDWRTRPPARALAGSFEALDALEALRERQPEGASAARLFSAWAQDYYWLSGRLLREAEAGDPAALDQAFRVTERLRARALLDALAAHPAAAGPDPSARRRHDAAQAAIVSAQRRLLGTDLPAAGREEATAALERAEIEEAEARRALFVPAGARGGPVRFASLHDVRAALEDDEALLSFQVALWEDLHRDFGGGAWLIAVTRGGARAFRLPDRVRLEPTVSLFLGLLERRDGTEASGAERLGADLLGEALAWLPTGVRRLVVVPDGVLHRLPFGALRDAGGPLVLRYEWAAVPSATLWGRWRDRPRRTLEPAVLAFADPELPRGGEVAEARGWPLAAGAPLGALPRARAEGRAAVRALGGESRLLAGRAASERALKTADLSAYGLVHFAAHALVDEDRPERSAVVLAPGAPGEDGLLQWREVAALGLDGRGVVLSACRSAGGEVLRGEGVMGLARAFFEAGAPVVVGSLWPLRDDEAARLSAGLYRGLGRGESVARALGAAQAEAHRAGLPAAAWAGLVALGDAGLAVAPPPSGGRPGPRGAPALFVAVLALVLIALLAAALRRA